MRTSQKPLRLSREPNMAKVQDNSLPVGSGSGQIVLVLQGGGALGAYQPGVYQALDEAGIEPDWVIGTSIGAINAGIIAGNRPADRLPRLREFWGRIQRDEMSNLLGGLAGWGAAAANAMTMLRGVPGFFAPNPWSA